MNYYHPILTRSDERASVWMEFRDSTRESSPLSTPRPVPDPTPYSVHEDSLTIKINASNFYGSQRSAFTTSQASNAFSVLRYGWSTGRRPDRVALPKFCMRYAQGLATISQGKSPLQHYPLKSFNCGTSYMPQANGRLLAVVI